MIKIDILQLLDRLEELIDHGWRLPLSSKVAIDEDAFLNIIDQMRITIPQEIKKAREVQLERDKYIAQANDEASRIISQAREDAAKQLDEHELRKAAQNRAQGVVERARQECESIRAGADDYAEARLRELGQHLEELQRVLQNGLNALEGRRAQRQKEISEGHPSAVHVASGQTEPPADS